LSYSAECDTIEFMPIYKGPEVGQNFETNFVRVGEIFYVPPRQFILVHKDLAQFENILGEVLGLREGDINAVDAGSFNFIEGELLVRGGSSSLRLPLSQLARQITLELARIQTPGYTVINQGMYNRFFKDTEFRFLA